MNQRREDNCCHSPFLVTLSIKYLEDKFAYILFERQRDTKKYIEWHLRLAGSLPKYLQQSWPGQAETWSFGTQFASPSWITGTEVFVPFMIFCLPRVLICRNLGGLTHLSHWTACLPLWFCFLMRLLSWEHFVSVLTHNTPSASLGRLHRAVALFIPLCSMLRGATR